ncbi:MAG TPA: hypothetical protein VEV85_10900 [Bryobacteraceae bacterium]|nr:hypothetical protein [Bryobacteraceae bacterium]
MRTYLALACATIVAAVTLWAQPPSGGGRGGGRGKNRPPSRPTPHWPDGHVNLGPLAGEKGVWEGNAGATLATNRSGGIDNPTMYLPTNPKISEVPFLPWAKAVYDYRQSSTTKDDPHVRCKASGGPRMFHTPYGFEFLDLPDQQRIYIVGVGGPHTWRVIYMDGRPHPKDVDPSFAGHSVGHWEGDALVVDTVGFNEKFWLTREGIPLTEKLHLTERFTRTDYDDLKYEATIDDPGAYSAPWTGGWWIRWQSNQELYEYVCQDNNRDVKHMYGGPRD